MRKLLIIAIVFCSVIFLVGAQAGFAKPRNTIINAVSEDCFNGIDDDENGLIDCEDPACEGAQNGTCETGLSGICAEGTLSLRCRRRAVRTE